MSLITRQGKGSKLTIQEMDNNLTYLEGLSGGGLEGTQYVFVQADGTDVENGQELQAAYNTAKNLASVITSLSNNILTGNGSISIAMNIISPIESVGDIPIGLNNFEVISDNGTEILQFDVIDYIEGVGISFSSDVSRTNVTSLKLQDVTLKRATVIASPSYYNFSSDFVMDEEYVDLVSLDGNRSVVFNGIGTISITANDVFVKGVDVGSKNFTIGDNLNLLKIENCQGGESSFGGDPILGSNPITVSGTFTDCVGGNNSFGGNGGTASGTFTDCQGGDFSFGGQNGDASGTFINCQGQNGSFGSFGTASGTFKNCQGGFASFGGNGIASGTFTDCQGSGINSFGSGASGTASGTFINCVGGNLSFGGNVGGTASGTFNNCQGGDNSFGGQGTASGTFINCVGGNISFGSGGNGIASGTFTGCQGGNDSFGGSGTLSGKLYYCRLTTGTFETVSGAGVTRLCIDGSNNENNQG